MEDLGRRLCPAFGAEERAEAMFLIERAVAEDLPTGDITAETLFAPYGRGGPDARLSFVSRETGVLCGLELVLLLIERLEDGAGGAGEGRVRIEARRTDGDVLVPGEPFLDVVGPAVTLLALERTALNFLQRLSGIATTTRRWVREIEGTGVELLDTRKTTPGWRRLEKYAVRMGGAQNHRPHLSAAYLVKDNHLAILESVADRRPAAWVPRLREARPDVLLEVEVDSRSEFLAAREAEVDAILLDNFPLRDLRWAVETNRRLPGRRPLLEASGGVTFATLRLIAETGVDRISAGALTHSARALDIGLDFIGDSGPSENGGAASGQGAGGGA